MWDIFTVFTLLYGRMYCCSDGRELNKELSVLQVLLKPLFYFLQFKTVIAIHVVSQ